MQLTPDSGAKFEALIEQLPDSEWRASARIILDTHSDIHVERLGPEMFDSEEEASAWVTSTARAKGFTVVILNMKLLLN